MNSVVPISKSGVLGTCVLLAVAAVALIAAFWTPHDPLAVNIDARLSPPSSSHPLGTDEYGRDVASRLMKGASTSTGIAALTTVLAILLGTPLGLLAGFGRAWRDRALMTLNDTLLAFPGILLALALITVLGSGVSGVIVALALAYTPAVVRIVRGSVLSIREKEYVEASRITGNSELYTVIRHVLPNSLVPVLVLATSMFGWVLLSESALSFLGLGVPAPAPTWGNMLSASRPFFESALWLSLAPGACIVLTLLAANLLGDALRDRLDPGMAGS